MAPEVPRQAELRQNSSLRDPPNPPGDRDRTRRFGFADWEVGRSVPGFPLGETGGKRRKRSIVLRPFPELNSGQSKPRTWDGVEGFKTDQHPILRNPLGENPFGDLPTKGLGGK